MAFTVEDRSITAGRAVIPWNGVWFFNGRLTGDDDPPAPGSSVVLTLGTLVLTGTVRDSGSHAGRPELLIVGGLSDGWRKKLPRRTPYRDRQGVKLTTVVSDIARDAGERAVIAPGLQGYLVGYSWTRAATTASAALGLVRVSGSPVPWHIRPDGATWIGPRGIVALVAGVEVVPRVIRPGAREATISMPADDFAAILPGTVLGLPGLPSGAYVRDLEITVTSAKAAAEVCL